MFKIKGYVVNIYDALNYDIDFSFINPAHYKLLNEVITNHYGYKNISRTGQLSNEVIGKSYRCRLNGIEINDQSFDRKLIKYYTNDVKKLIDRVDGWIECTFKGIDVFKRLLINVTIPSLHINLCDYLLTKSIKEDKPIFTRYIKKNYY